MRKFQLLHVNVSVSFYIIQKELSRRKCLILTEWRVRYWTKCHSQSRMGRYSLITSLNSILSLLSTFMHSLSGNLKSQRQIPRWNEEQYAYNHNFRSWVSHTLHNVEVKDLPMFALPSILFYFFNLALNGSDKQLAPIHHQKMPSLIHFILSCWVSIKFE